MHREFLFKSPIAASDAVKDVAGSFVQRRRSGSEISNPGARNSTVLVTPRFLVKASKSGNLLRVTAGIGVNSRPGVTV